MQKEMWVSEEPRLDGSYFAENFIQFFVQIHKDVNISIKHWMTKNIYWIELQIIKISGLIGTLSKIARFVHSS